MEKLHTVGKENLFKAVNCSPILSSAGVLKEHGTERLIYSPLSERNLPCQGNRLYDPGTDKAFKVGLFLSTPVQQPPSSLPDNHTDSWEEIRILDEEELWIERTQVVTKEDHLFYFEIAKEVVDNIIENLPILDMDESTGESDNTVVAADVTKNHLVNGVNAGGNAEEIETVHNGNDMVGDERKEDIAINIKDVSQNCCEDARFSDQLVGKSDLEQGDPDEKGNLEKDQPVEQSGLEHNQPVEKNALEEVQPSEKNELEGDNDFIHSCSELDTTVKEASLSDDSCLENTLSEEKSLEDLDETVREVLPDEQASSAHPLTEDKKDFEMGDDINLEFDENAFKPAAVFGLELDFLEKCGNTGATDYESELARQSLYVKFDPLVEARKNDEIKQDFNDLSKINPADLLFQGAISSDDLLGMDTPPAKPVVSRRALLAQTQKTETEESTATSTVVAPVDLFDLSPTQNAPSIEKTEEAESSKSESNIAVAEEESSLVQPLQFSKKDLEKAVEEEREKLSSRWNLQNSLHEGEMEKLLEERNKLLKERNEIQDENKVVKTLMMEYEQTMAQMIKDRENVQSEQEKSNSEIVQERDQLQRDLNNTEKSFAHLHEKFGKLKTAVESYRKNEDVLKKVVKDLQEHVKNAEAKYQVLKGHAEQKLQEASAEINRVQATCKSEIAGLQAAFKLEKAKNTSLQQSLEQKIAENKELTAICDELIGKVGVS